MASSSSDPVPKLESSSGAAGGESSEAAMIANEQLLLYREVGGNKKAKKERGSTAKERISKMPPCTAGKRSSIYRGVTRHRWTGRYEAHLWDKSTWNQNQNKKGKQVYLGAYDDEEAAARAYDLAALKYWGPGTLINFPVNDYTRDLAEMQNVSREEYLASLRRKSSGFSRGISKYRGLSSRWDSSLGCLAGSDYLNTIRFGDDPATESEFVGSFPIDRKVDLTPHIKWWGGSNKTRQAESVSKMSEEIKHGCAEDGGELKTSEWVVHHTEPYQMPRLGMPLDGKRHKSSAISALTILSQSAAYKSLQEKATERQEKGIDNGEKENMNISNEMDYGKAVEKLTSYDVISDKLGAGLGMVGGSSLQKNWYPLTPFLSAPLLTGYSATNHLVDPMIWSSLVSASPAGLPHNPETSKTETSSTYTLFQPEE